MTLSDPATGVSASLHDVEGWRITLWTGVRGGRRVITGLEQHPWPAGRRDGEADKRSLKWLRSRLAEDAAHIASAEVVPYGLSAVSHRSIPVGRLLQEQASALRADGRARATPASKKTSAPPTTQDLAALPYLRDAVEYAEAVASGVKAPAKVVAELRGVSLRTAQGRIATARRLGLLTPSDGPRAGGDLTDKARHLKAHAGVSGTEPPRATPCARWSSLGFSASRWRRPWSARAGMT